MKIPWYRKLLFRSAPREATDNQAGVESGSPEAQTNLGFLLASGSTDRQDYVGAAACYRSAADRGYALAQNNLGIMFLLGQGMAKDPVEARKWFRRAANQGDAAAQFHLGASCSRLSMNAASAAESAESRIEAFTWLQLAAAQGYRNADVMRERVNLAMTHAEVAEGNRRINAFVVTPES